MDRERRQGQNDDTIAMLQELRVLQHGAQVLTSFLVIVPFNQAFGILPDAEKWVFLTAFLASLASLIFFGTPAERHRMLRAEQDPEKFKRFTTRVVLVAMAFLSLAWTLAVELVVYQVMGLRLALAAAAVAALLAAIGWWLLPVVRRDALQKR